MLKGKFITITTESKQERSEIIKIRVKTNKIENKKIIEKMNKTKSWISVNIKKIDKPLVAMTKGKKKKRERELKLLKSGMKGDITNHTEIIRVITEDNEKWYASKLGNLEEMDRIP